MAYGCFVVSIESSHKDANDVMYGVVLPPNHKRPRYLDVIYADIEFNHTLPPMLTTVPGAKVLDSVQGQVVPQKSRHAMSLLDADKWVAAGLEEMRAIADKQVIN